MRLLAFLWGLPCSAAAARAPLGAATLSATLAALGPWAPAAFLAVYIAGALLFIPVSIFAIGAAAAFSFWEASFLTLLASNIAAILAFLIGRHWLRGFVIRRLKAHPGFEAVREAVAPDGWKLVLLLRLTPIFPFGLLNYGLAITDVRLSDYVWGTMLGMIPANFAFMYLAYSATGLARAGKRTPLEWAMAALGIVASVAAIWVISRRAKKVLDGHLRRPKRTIHK